MLRGPQTPGELRGRTERLHRFEDLSEVQSALQRLMKPLVQLFPRQPGSKEARYAHLLSGEHAGWGAAAAPFAAAVESGSDRIAVLEDRVAQLRNEVSDLKQRLGKIETLF